MSLFTSVSKVVYAVLLSLSCTVVLNAKVTAYVDVQTSPTPQVTISWNDQGGNTVELVRRPLGLLGLETWTVLDEDASSPYVDETVALGESYEYSIRSITESRFRNRFAHMAVTLEAPLSDERGAVLLVVEDKWSTELAAEIGFLELNLVADGWGVERLDWNREGENNSAALKAAIQDAVAVNPEINSLFIFGAVEMVMSGWLDPDVHGNHPHETDLFYGDIDWEWQDTLNSGNYTAGDGIYDESYYPSEIELRTGRVTFHGMPSYKKNEGEYLRDYIHKEHAYRYLHREVTYQNYVGDEGYLYATNASLKPMVGEGNWTDVGNLDTIIGEENYLVAIGKRDMGKWDAARDGFQKAIFTASFRSHNLEWWDTDNNMRGMLSQPDWGLTALWGGRPAWYLHKLAAGRPIGQAVIETQNDLLNPAYAFDGGMYQQARDYDFFSDEVARNYVSANLIGDPTLRVAHVRPVEGLSIRRLDASNVELSWDASSAVDLIGYHVYKSNERLGTYSRLTTTPIVDLTYSITALDDEETWFQVRAVANVTVPTGVYEEQSHGRFALARADGSVNSAPVATDFEVVGKINTPLRFAFQGSDVDGDMLTPILLDNPDSGQIRWWEGNPYYVSKRDTPVEETATFVLFDGVTVSEPATITFKATEFGDTLLAWEFPDGTTVAQEPGFSRTHISSTAISGGPGTSIISAWPGTDSYTSRFIGSSLDETGDYFTWTVSPDPGYQMHLSRINLGICGTEYNQVSYELRVSDDGFDSYEVVPMEFGSIVGRGLNGNAGILDSVDCSGVALLQNQANPVEFRLHWWDTAGSSAVVGLGKITDPVYYDAIEDVSIRGTMTNALGLPAIVAEQTDVMIDEGTTVDLLVALSSAPSGPVTLNVGKVSGDPSLVLESAATLEFDADNWQHAQIVRLSAMNDDNLEDGQAVFEITATDYTSLRLNVTEIDSERAPEAVADAYSLLPDSVLEVEAPGVLANDFDGNEDPLTAWLVSDVNNGGLVFNSDGSFTYTPNPGYLGADSFSYEADDGDQRSEVVTVDLDISHNSLLVSVFGEVRAYQPEIYSEGQYSNGQVVLENEGRLLRIMNNGWYMVDLSQVEITADTVLEFDFSNSIEGEIHGIYLDDDASDINEELCFKFTGSQDWGDHDLNDYDSSRPDPKHYKINIGSYYTGTYRYLVFVQDHDDGSSDAVSTFSNVRIYNPSPATVWADARGLDPFEEYSLNSDANGDGRSHAYHFAFDTNPLGDGSDEGKQSQVLAVDPNDGGSYLTLTLPVRAGAIFSGDPLTSAPIDGLVYEIIGDGDLIEPEADLGVEEVWPALSSELPELGDYDAVEGSDWEYRSFRLTTPVDSEDRGFIWVRVLEAP